MDGAVGYCPLANKTTIEAFQKLDKFVYGNATGCSTLDRYNVEAQIDCGMG